MSEANASPAAAPVADAPAQESAQPNSNSVPAESNAAEISSEAELNEALENGEISQKEAQKLIKKFQLKVRGKTVEREVDLSDDEFLKNQLQLAEVSKQSMQDAAELKKAYQKELQRFKEDPWSVIQELGLDPDQLAEMRIQQRIEEMKKSPEQLEKERITQELQQAREEAKRLKEEKEQIEMQKLQEQAAVQIKDEISSAIAAHKTLPNTPYVEKRIADALLWAMNNGYEDATAEDVVPLVEQEMRKELAELYDQLPDEMLEQFVGKKTMERMRKKRIAQAKAAPSVNNVKQTAASMQAAPKQEERKPVRSRDFFKNLGKQK
jgi:hypothetical protein